MKKSVRNGSSKSNRHIQHRRLLAYTPFTLVNNYRLKKRKTGVLPSHSWQSKRRTGSLIYIWVYQDQLDANSLALIFYYTFCSTCFGCNTHPSSGAIYNVHADGTVSARVHVHLPVPSACTLSLILRRSRTGTVWFYTSTSNKRAARPKLYTKSLTRDLKRLYSRFTLLRISINLQAPRFFYIGTGVSLLFRERFLYI